MKNVLDFSRYLQKINENENSSLPNYISDFIEELHRRFDVTTDEVREIIDSYGDDLEIGFADGIDVKTLLNALVNNGKLKWRR